MIAKRFRFHGYGALKFVYSKGSVVRARSLALKYIPNNRRTDSRLAVVVSKKVAKRAPQRNRIRRRVYEAVRREWGNLNHPYDMVLTVFDERIATMSSNELQKTIIDLLSQAKIYK